MQYSATEKTGFMLRDVTTGFICQQVNCRGAMGSGIALAIMTKWPQVRVAYLNFCAGKEPESLLGEMLPVQVDENLWVLNLFGQLDYGKDPKGQPEGRYTNYQALEVAFTKAANYAEAKNRNRAETLVVNYPDIGCGLAGGDWTIVSKIADAALDTMVHTHWTFAAQ